MKDTLQPIQFFLAQYIRYRRRRTDG